MHANNGSRQNIEQLENQEICSSVTDFEDVWFPSQINSKVFHSTYIKIPGNIMTSVLVYSLRTYLNAVSCRFLDF
jgi:hypothetical protein